MYRLELIAACISLGMLTCDIGPDSTTLNGSQKLSEFKIIQNIYSAEGKSGLIKAIIIGDLILFTLGFLFRTLRSKRIADLLSTICTFSAVAFFVINVGEKQDNIGDAKDTELASDLQIMAYAHAALASTLFLVLFLQGFNVLNRGYKSKLNRMAIVTGFILLGHHIFFFGMDQIFATIDGGESAQIHFYHFEFSTWLYQVIIGSIAMVHICGNIWNRNIFPIIITLGLMGYYVLNVLPIVSALKEDSSKLDISALLMWNIIACCGFFLELSYGLFTASKKQKGNKKKKN